MATRTRTTKQTPAKKTTAKPPAKKTSRKPAARKTAAPMVKRPHDFMTDGQGFAIVAARIAGITTPHIRDWCDHHDGTLTRALTDGTLHYNVPTRTLTWQAACRMGAVHTYPIDSPSTATAARVHAATCSEVHADLTGMPPLTRDELAELGIHTGPMWALHLPGEPDTVSKVIPLPCKRRALGDELTRAKTAAADTQPLNLDDIHAGLTERADDTAKEHPEP